MLYSGMALAQTVASSAAADGDDIVERIKENPPAALKDGQIVLSTKDGKTTKYNANEFKIVPRYKYIRKKSEPAKVVTKEVVKEKLPNQISLYAGVGYDGMVIKKSDQNSNSADVTKYRDLVLGLAYTRSIDLNWSVSGIVTSNESLLIGGGYSW
jgi:hypothetical protein